MTEPMLLWGLGLFALAFLLFIIEVFVPTGGVMGVFVGVAAIAGVVCFFQVSTTWGLISVIFLFAVTPFAIAGALKVWPNTPIGRRLILGSSNDDPEDGPPPDEQSDDLRQTLIGATGVAVSDLRPVGTVRIEGERIEASAEGGMIPAGQEVRITAVEGRRIKVRAVK